MRRVFSESVFVMLAMSTTERCTFISVVICHYNYDNGNEIKYIRLYLQFILLQSSMFQSRYVSHSDRNKVINDAIGKMVY